MRIVFGMLVLLGLWTHGQAQTPTPGVWPDQVLISRNALNSSSGQFVEIEVSSSRSGRYRISVLTGSGELVALLADQNLSSSGFLKAFWTGHNQEGEPVASGVYLIHIQAVHRSLTRKIVVLR